MGLILTGVSSNINEELVKNKPIKDAEMILLLLVEGRSKIIQPFWLPYG